MPGIRTRSIVLTALSLIALGAMGASLYARGAALTGNTSAGIVIVTASDFAFDAPDTVTAGPTTFQLANQGSEMHHIWLVRLDEGKTLADFTAVMQAGGHAFPNWAVDVGGPNVGSPGMVTNATVDLAAGNYVIICVVPSADGKPHIMKGMARPLTVVAPKSSTGAAKPAVAAKADIEVELADYGFKFSKQPTAGRHIIRFTNSAAQSHEAVFLKLAPGKTPMDLVAWLEKQEGPPPAAPYGGITGIAKGVENTVEITFEPGEYGLICFVPDHEDGKPHFAHGMVQQFAVR